MKEMCNLTTHSTHFSTVMWKEKEGNVLFNDALNTFQYGYMEGKGRKCFI